jgi:hypothetical protein
MRYYSPDGWWTEKRGKMFYAFCDDGCKAIVRDQRWKADHAAGEHRRREHGGQTAFEFPPVVAGDPDAPPPF